MAAYVTPRDVLRDRMATRARNHPEPKAKREAQAIVAAIASGSAVNVNRDTLGECLWYSGMLTSSELWDFREGPPHWTLHPDGSWAPVDA